MRKTILITAFITSIMSFSTAVESIDVCSNDNPNLKNKINKVIISTKSKLEIKPNISLLGGEYIMEQFYKKEKYKSKIKFFGKTIFYFVIKVFKNYLMNIWKKYKRNVTIKNIVKYKINTPSNIHIYLYSNSNQNFNINLINFNLMPNYIPMYTTKFENNSYNLKIESINRYTW